MYLTFVPSFMVFSYQDFLFWSSCSGAKGLLVPLEPRDAVLTPGPEQWVKDLMLPQLWRMSQLWLWSDLWLGNHMPQGGQKSKNIRKKVFVHFLFFFNFLFCFIYFLLFRAAYMAYGNSQARGWLGATAASLRQSHSYARSEPHLQPAPELTAMLDP